MTKIGYKIVSHLEAENLLCNVLKGKTYQEQFMIDYNLLNESLEYYNSNGFTRIESPWSVAKEIDDITRPEEKIPFQLKHNNKCLVASGEQSFLYLYLKGFLPLGKFQTITPCFRSDDFDLLHTKYFMKNELIITDEVNEEHLNKKKYNGCTWKVYRINSKKCPVHVDLTEIILMMKKKMKYEKFKFRNSPFVVK